MNDEAGDDPAPVHGECVEDHGPAYPLGVAPMRIGQRDPYGTILNPPDRGVDDDHGAGAEDTHGRHPDEVDGVVPAAEPRLSSHAVDGAVAPEVPVAAPYGQGGREALAALGVVPLVEQRDGGQNQRHHEYADVRPPLNRLVEPTQLPFEGDQQQRVEREQYLIVLRTGDAEPEEESLHRAGSGVPDGAPPSRLPGSHPRSQEPREEAPDYVVRAEAKHDALVRVDGAAALVPVIADDGDQNVRRAEDR